MLRNCEKVGFKSRPGYNGPQLASCATVRVLNHDQRALYRMEYGISSLPVTLSLYVDYKLALVDLLRRMAW